MATSTTKARILELLAEEPRPAEALAGALGLSRVAVQRHLRELLAEGRVRYQDRKNGGRGRPRRYWRAVGEEASVAEFCAGLLEALRERLGEEGARELLVEVQARRLGSVADESALYAWLAERGYAPRLAGGVLEQRRCPRLALARRHPELCQAEARAYARALGRPVRLEARIPDGAPACRFVLGA